MLKGNRNGGSLSSVSFKNTYFNKNSESKRQDIGTIDLQSNMST
jgi:hypothetical protein